MTRGYDSNDLSLNDTLLWIQSLEWEISKNLINLRKLDRELLLEEPKAARCRKRGK